MNNLLIMIFMMLMVLICVTFLTLLEQKLLSYIQTRKGPNVVGYLGLIQPFSDALKLFSKELLMPIFSNFFIYYVSPVLSFLISLILWLLFPFYFYCISFNFMFLLMFSIMSTGVYFIMISGWSSNSNYALLGSLRSIAQTISYEVCMILFFLCYMIYILSFNLLYFFNFQKNISFFFLNLMLSMILFSILLAETNRAPFDFAEGESELVSGFNIEYSSGSFTLIFLAEYSMILFMSLLFILILLFNSLFYFNVYLKFMFISYLFIWVRGTYPRNRYDKLMNLMWKIFLFYSLFMLMIFIFFKIIMIY